jgi:hypothetical protein
MFFLVRNWPHSVGQNHFFLKMIFNRDSAIQKCFQKILHSLQGRKLGSLSAVRTTCHTVRTTRTFRPNLPLCQEVSNSSSLHPSRRFSSMSERLSVFDLLQDFFPKHSYGKITATVRTTWIPVRKRSSKRQVSQFKSKRPDASQHGPEARASDMEIACIKSTVRPIFPLVWTREAFIWKLLAADLRPSGRQGTTIRTWLRNRI